MADFDGNEWRQQPEIWQRGYISGVIDGWANITTVTKDSPQAKNPQIRFWTDLTKCMSKGMTHGQVFAIVKKYMDNNPADWHSAMASLIWTALSEVCPQELRKMASNF